MNSIERVLRMEGNPMLKSAVIKAWKECLQIEMIHIAGGIYPRGEMLVLLEEHKSSCLTGNHVLA